MFLCDSGVAGPHSISVAVDIISRSYHVPDVVILFRQLRGWFKLRVWSTFVAGGPCCFSGILGMLNGISFDYTGRTSTLPSCATVMTSISVSMAHRTQPQHNCDMRDSYKGHLASLRRSEA